MMMALRQRRKSWGAKDIRRQGDLTQRVPRLVSSLTLRDPEFLHRDGPGHFQERELTVLPREQEQSPQQPRTGQSQPEPVAEHPSLQAQAGQG